MVYTLAVTVWTTILLSVSFWVPPEVCRVGDKWVINASGTAKGMNSLHTALRSVVRSG